GTPPAIANPPPCQAAAFQPRRDLDRRGRRRQQLLDGGSASRGISPRPRTRSHRYAQKRTPNFRHVFFQLANVSGLRRPAALRVPLLLPTISGLVVAISVALAPAPPATHRDERANRTGPVLAPGGPNATGDWRACASSSVPARLAARSAGSPAPGSSTR